MKAVRRFISRLAGTLLPGRHDRRIREEFDQHAAMLAEDGVRNGLDPVEARRQALVKLGSLPSTAESYRDARGFAWFDSLGADIVFGWRQLNKRRVASAAAILSLALTIGAATTAFRLVDALMLRPLPVSEPESLSYMATTYVDREGRLDNRDDFDYPSFRQYREAVGDRADVLLVGVAASPQDAIVDNGTGTEKVFRQFVSGNVFAVFGLRAAAGRLLLPSDDLKPGGHPVAVISHEYWTRRFSRDPSAVTKSIRFGGQTYQIIGVTPEGFSGTAPGDIADVFLPSMMNPQALDAKGWSWFRIWLRPKAGVTPEQVRGPLQAVLQREHEERLKSFASDTPKATVEAMLREEVILLPASAGVSRLQKQLSRPLLILSLLVGLVLLIACFNVANLMTAQATARAREMAVRVSIGASRMRLVQLVLVESVLLSIAATACGALFAQWFTPYVISLLRIPQDPVRLFLDNGWRELAFGAALAGTVALLFGLAPALRASSTRPVSALKGTDDPRGRQRTMQVLLAVQVALCIVVLFTAALFGDSFRRLLDRPLGFDAKPLLLLDLKAEREEPVAAWMQAVEGLQGLPGVESAALASWPPLSGNRWTGSVRVPGRDQEPRGPYFLQVSPGYLKTMRMGPLDGRDFLPGDMPPRLEAQGQPAAGVGIVNEAFARAYFAGANPVGRVIEVRQSKDQLAQMEIVGLMRDAVYSELREANRPIVYVPLTKRNGVTVAMRISGRPLDYAAAARQKVAETGGGIGLVNAQPFDNFIRWQTVRERLLSVLASFFALVALALAAVGLYGVLHYSVTCQQREIGIRMALGARARDVVSRLTWNTGLTVGVGAVIGVAGGVAGGCLLERLLYEVKATDPAMIALPLATLGAAALAAAIGPAVRAARTDPAQTLRNE